MTKLNILLVEDSKRLRDLELELLNAHGELEVGAFSDSEGDALALLAASTFDVVILDLKLKSGTGFGILRWLAESVERRAEKVIVFTNHVDEDFRRHAAKLGAMHFFDKTKQFPELVAALLGLAHSRQEPRPTLN